MIIHPNFDPVAIHLGPLAVRWYGLMYLVGFIAAIVIGRLRLKLPHVAAQGWTAKDIDDMMFYGVLGTVLGGRLGYVLFYKADFYFSHPLDVFKVWEGGMSFHGGFLGVTLAMMLFAWQRKRHWLQVTDFVAPMVPTGLAAGRLGNFINGELWGRVTDPSATVGDAVPRRDAGRCRMAAEASGTRREVASCRRVHAVPDAAAPSFAALRNRARGHRAVLRAVLLLAQVAADGCGVRAVPDRLRSRALHRRVRTRAGRLPRAARARAVDGAVAVAADDRGRCRVDGVGVSPPRGERERDRVICRR
ncbi:Prolipoprotein diacylglyceryl transferase [Burkholderia dolosa AU0158]|nr:Prolipoprotein diacylglyceryl transferase [Burkholderia dolosa AU0158]